MIDDLLGMNLGLQDSHNLTWKLALVMHGIAPASILETYEAERKPVADAIIKMTARLLEVGLAQDFVRRLIRSAIFTIAPYIIPYLTASKNPVTMLTIRYHENAINQHSKSQASIAQDFQVGQRARDGQLHVIRKRGIDLAEVEGQVVRLHELTVGPGIFHIAVFTSDMFAASSEPPPAAIKGTETTTAATLAKDIEEYLAAWRSKWTYKSSNEIARSSGNGQDISPPPSPDFKSPLTSSEAIPYPLRANKLIMVHVIASDKISAKPNDANGTHPEVVSDADPLITKQPGDGKIYLDQQGVLHQKYGIQANKGPGTIVVIRPDSHIGYRVLGASKSAWDDVSQYLDSILIN
ncbi:hypothetical protein BG011_006930 [Mortierella polycephala]|uniref:FAD-binding domain-containing protein n=1 Tax=Mortierella polycephala TaxID=41804 RepID=A0A9P6TYW9_9FUNG|nr:hypothetical protein BG011_006930 [Mortierella polycephala]